MNIERGKDKSIRLVFVVSDLSQIGGIGNRTKIILRESEKRSAEYIVISRRYAEQFSMPGAYSLDRDRDEIIKMLEGWSSDNTVLVIANSLQLQYPQDIRDIFGKFPILSLCSGQMAFMIQETDILTRQEFLKTNLASCILCFSNGDIQFQRQLGIHGQVKIKPPIVTREINSYSTDLNTRYGYVGRVDFHAKDCERLLDIAHAMKKAGLPPLLVFTSSGESSPDFKKFIELAHSQSILNHLEIILNCEDKQRMYSKLRMLILPSKKESSGNVILEAFSFGVPVLAASYAPGPAEIIGTGDCGILLDAMSGGLVVKELLNISDDEILHMSSNAFHRHKKFSIELHMNRLEKIARDVILKFDGENRLPILPRLRPVELLAARLAEMTEKYDALVELRESERAGPK